MVQPWRSLSLFPFPFVNPADGHFIVSQHNSHTSPEPTPGKQIKEKGKKPNRCEERRKTFQTFFRQFKAISVLLSPYQMSSDHFRAFKSSMACLRLNTDLFRRSQATSNSSRLNTVHILLIT